MESGGGGCECETRLGDWCGRVSDLLLILAGVETNHIIFAHWHDLCRKRPLRVDLVVVKVLRDELLRGDLLSTRHDTDDKFLEFHGVVAAEEVEVDAVRLLLHGHRLLVGLVFENELFKKVEGALVVDLLAHLHGCPPCVLCCHHVAIGALEVVDHHFDHEHLLKNYPVVHFLLDCELHLQAFRVRFRPDKGRIDELDFVEALDAFQADLHQLFAFWLACRPGLRRVQIATAISASLHRNALRDALRNVSPRPDAVCAHGCWVPYHRHSARTASGQHAENHELRNKQFCHAGADSEEKAHGSRRQRVGI
jgi:hypothetical protein